jgi:hypothetical protein
MSPRSTAGVRQPALSLEHALDPEEVLEALRALIGQVSSPVVQECLRVARCEIAFLTSTEGEFTEDEDEEAGEEAETAGPREAAA